MNLKLMIEASAMMVCLFPKYFQFGADMNIQLPEIKYYELESQQLNVLKVRINDGNCNASELGLFIKALLKLY